MKGAGREEKQIVSGFISGFLLLVTFFFFFSTSYSTVGETEGGCDLSRDITVQEGGDVAAVTECISDWRRVARRGRQQRRERNFCVHILTAVPLNCHREKCGKMSL